MKTLFVVISNCWVHITTLTLLFFRNYVAKQKEESSEVGKFSVRSLHKISEEVKSLSASISTISSAVNR